MQELNNAVRDRYPTLTLQACNYLQNALTPYAGIGTYAIRITPTSVAYVGPTHERPLPNEARSHFMLLIKANLLTEIRPNHYWLTQQGFEAVQFFKNHP